MPAPGGAANAVCMQWAAAARHARQRRETKVTPSSLVLRAATATSGSPTANAVPSAVDRSKRDKVQSCTGSAKGGRCWHKPACRPRPRRPTSPQQQGEGIRTFRTFYTIYTSVLTSSGCGPGTQIVGALQLTSYKVVVDKITEMNNASSTPCTLRYS